MEVTGKYLLERGFKMVGENDGYEYIIKQYGGYHDYVFFNIRDKRLVIQYQMNLIELYDCNIEKVVEALALVGLPTIDRLIDINE